MPAAPNRPLAPVAEADIIIRSAAGNRRRLCHQRGGYIISNIIYSEIPA